MLQIPVKEGESIERALKKYKKKFERTRRFQREFNPGIEVSIILPISCIKFLYVKESS